MADIDLYSYWRSSAAYRIRIALALKGIDVNYLPISLINDGGEQHTRAYRQINPMALLPAIRTNEHVLTQSVAILEYLEETHTQPALLPEDAISRAQIRAMVNLIACDIHPLNNLRVQHYLKNPLGLNQTAINDWYQHWVKLGFAGLETLLVQESGRYCFGDKLSLADVCLIPQVYNAKRFKVSLNDFPNIERIYDECNKLTAFIAAKPENQPDSDNN